MILGLACGLFVGEKAAALRVVGDAFILLMQVAVIPYIVVSLITALGQLSLDEARRLGITAGCIVLGLWSIGTIVILLAPLAFPDWPSSSFFSTSVVEEPKRIDFLRLYIPANPFASLANGVVPAIVVFSLLIGIALIGVKTKQALLDPLTAAAEALMAVAGHVSRLAPYGVFALTASAAGTLGLEDLDRLQVYVTIHATLAILLSLWVLPRLISIVTPLHHKEIIHALRGALITAFAAGSVLLVLPMLADACKKLLRNRWPPDEQAHEAVSMVDALIPMAYNIPSLGNMLSLVFVLFAGWSIGSTVPVRDYPVVVGAGLASLFGGPVLAIPFLLDLLELPQDLFQVFMTVDVVGSRFSTLVAVMTIATTGLLGASAQGGRLRPRAHPLVRFTATTIALLAGILFAIHVFYTHVVVAPYTQAQALRGLDLLSDPQPVVLNKDIPPDRMDAATGPADLAKIRQRGTLRACYFNNDFPASFLNTKGELVGFDIELVHRLAGSLGLPIEFLPVRGEDDAKRQLQKGVCDLLGSTLATSIGRAETFTLTIPVYTSSVGLLVPDHQRNAFRRWEEIRRQGAKVRLGVPANPEAMDFARSMLPQATLVPINSLADQRRMLQAASLPVEAIADLSEEGAAWTVLYPRVHLVVPEPIVFTEQSLAVAHGNQLLVQALDAWITEEKGRGTVADLYRYWMLGQALKQSQPPRWSVMRNVLHWTR